MTNSVIKNNNIYCIRVTDELKNIAGNGKQSWEVLYSVDGYKTYPLLTGFYNSGQTFFFKMKNAIQGRCDFDVYNLGANAFDCTPWVFWLCIPN